jgi:hypothetical protein
MLAEAVDPWPAAGVTVSSMPTSAIGIAMLGRGFIRIVSSLPLIASAVASFTLSLIL